MQWPCSKAALAGVLIGAEAALIYCRAMTSTWNRRRVVLLVLAGVVLAGGAGGYAYHRHAERSRSVRALSCIRSIALASMMYAGTQPSTQPADGGLKQGEAAWDLLKAGGQVVLMRHAATTPGNGDPANFRLGDRATQRNLSDAGRAQAARVGEAFRGRGVRVDRVLSSQYCRCLDTAHLAFGRAEEAAVLNSAPEDPAKRREQTAAARKLIRPPPPGANLVLVTHSTNVHELTGLTVEKGEMLILTPDPSSAAGFKVSARLDGK
jgi:phosphohistidine phosphatase SixA